MKQITRKQVLKNLAIFMLINESNFKYNAKKNTFESSYFLLILHANNLVQITDKKNNKDVFINFTFMNVKEFRTKLFNFITLPF